MLKIKIRIQTRRYIVTIKADGETIVVIVPK